MAEIELDSHRSFHYEGAYERHMAELAQLREYQEEEEEIRSRFEILDI